jgi:uncharacterized damage-inducible protein DinB
MNTSFQQEFIQQSVFRINESTRRVIKCLEQIDETELWQRPNEQSNSIGNLLLHLCGNITQYILSCLGETEDVRVRDKEFSAREEFNKQELSAKLQASAGNAIAIIENLDDKQLLKLYSVQGFRLSGIGIIIHVTEHYSYHTGQIAFWIKLLKNKDLSFYANVNLSMKNKN